MTPIEQHVHSFLEMIPLMAMLSVISLHWGQFLALFGLGSENAQFVVKWKSTSLPIGYVASILAAIVVFELLPYLDELARGFRAGTLSAPKR